MRSSTRGLLVSLLLAAVAGCYLSTRESQVVQVLVQPVNPTALVGDAIPFSAHAVFDDGSGADVTAEATWSSSDEHVASVDESGTAAAVFPGVATITATLDGVEGRSSLAVGPRVLGECCAPATLTVHEVEDPCEELTIGSVSGELVVPRGGTLQLEASCQVGEGAVDVTDEVHWTSSEETVATVSNEPATAGEARAHREGWTGIFASYTRPDGSTIESNRFPLTVEAGRVLAIEIEPERASITAGGGPLPYTAVCTYAGVGDESCTSGVLWQSTEESVAVVSNAAGSAGVATAVGCGATEVTASQGDVTSNVAVLLVDCVLRCDSVTVTPAAPGDLPAGTDQAFHATCTWTDGTVSDVTGDVTWGTSDSAVATIGADGVATGVAAGTTDITATFPDPSGPVVSAPVALTVADVPIVRFYVDPVGAGVAVGGSVDLDAYVVWASGARSTVTADPGCVWTTSDPGIASVHAGAVTAVAVGFATITASFVGRTADAYIDVSAP